MLFVLGSSLQSENVTYGPHTACKLQSEQMYRICTTDNMKKSTIWLASVGLTYTCPNQTWFNKGIDTTATYVLNPQCRQQIWSTHWLVYIKSVFFNLLKSKDCAWQAKQCAHLWWAFALQILTMQDLKHTNCHSLIMKQHVHVTGIADPLPGCTRRNAYN